MAVIGEAFIQIRATDTGFEASVVKDVESATAAASEAAKIEAKVDTSKATGPLDLLKSKMQSFAGSKNPVASALGDVETAAGGSEGALAGLATGGLAVAGAAAVAFAAKSVSAFQSYAGGVIQIQRVTGATATQSSQLAAAFKAVGIEPDQAAPALGRFAKNLDTNAAKLGALGVQVTKNSAGNVDMTQTFLNVADAVQKAQDPSEKLNLVMTAFGKSGQTLLPILEQGKAGIQGLFDEAGRHGQLLSQKDLDTSYSLSLAFRDLKEDMSAAFLEAGKVIVPFIASIVHIGQDIAYLIETSKTAKTIIKDALEVAFGPLIAIVKGIESLSGWFDKMTGQHHDNAAAATADAAATSGLTDETTGLAGADATATKAEQDLQKAQDAHAATIKTLTSAISDVTDAQKSLKTADDQVKTSSTALAAARQKLSDLQRAGVVNTQAVTQAQKDLTTATDAVAAAQDKVVSAGRAVDDAHRSQMTAIQQLTDAQQAYDDLVSGKTATKDMAAHHNDLAHAQLTVNQATLAQSDAQKKLADLQASGTASVHDLTQAQLDLDSANLSLSDAQDNLTQTQQNLTDIQNEGKAGSDSLKTATQNLQTANDNLNSATYNLMQTQKDQQGALTDLATAQQTVIDKQGALTTAMQPDPKLVAAIQTASTDVTNAQNNVRDAMDQASQKAADLGEKQAALNTLQHDSIPDLLTVKNNLQDIVNLQPQAASFLGPTLQAVNVLIAAAQAALPNSAGTVVGFKTMPAGMLGPGSPIYGNALPPGMLGPPSPAHAAGGFASGSFIAGENGPELISMMPSGGAMVYPRGSPEAAAGGLSAPTINLSITASFGAGTNADDVLSAMRAVAQNEMTTALQAALTSANAGRRR